MQGVFSAQLGIPEHKVRVIAPDVGGGFGIKLNVYAEEVAVAGASRLVRRPIKFSADRMELFVSDTHARDHGSRRASRSEARRDHRHEVDESRGRRLRDADAVQRRRKHDGVTITGAAL